MKTFQKMLMGCAVAVAAFGAFQMDASAAVTRISQYGGYEIVDVTDFGADKTGRKDSAAALNKAVDEAYDLQFAGEKAVVYLPAGTFQLDKYTPIDSGAITIVAEDSTKINAKNAFQVRSGCTATVEGGIWQNVGQKETMFFGNTGGSINIKDAKIVNPYRAVTVQAGKCELNNVTVTGARGNSDYAVSAQSKSELVVRNSNFSKNIMAIMVKNSSAQIDSVKIEKNKNMGMQANEKSKVTISNSTIARNGNGYTPGKTDFKGHGIGVYTKSKVTVNNCLVKSNDQCGISLVGASVTVNNSKILSNGRQGIGTRERCNVTLKNSQLSKNGYNTQESANGYNGLILVDGSKAKITNCKFEKNKYAGIWVSGGGCVINVKKTVFNGNKMFPIDMTTDRGTITLVSDRCTYKNSPYGVRFA